MITFTNRPTPDFIPVKLTYINNVETQYYVNIHTPIGQLKSDLEELQLCELKRLQFV